ncbi:DNA methyltransferase 1-associated protein 1 [Schistosoma haematobium]|uniref:DNA methyltransferase 1-associated protein 1 n=3 Tax=Schistosoma TaxID=6181 RepID=A0A095C461_SCHHA|nr:DNA methyltransferase 1-associated protein 1 [Schistosoma haematobium]KAH9581705.1 DNA methyltransferase 1-associated protein 1 [Schistosoma haematobium]
MGTAIDVLDILDLNESSPRKSMLDREAILSRAEKRKSSRPNPPPKRPDHVPREVWGLHSTLNNNLPPIMPTDNTPLYKQPKAVIGVGRVRSWQWTPFTNSARQDNLVLYHWRRESADPEANKDYYFARYNKHVTVPEYTTEEYETMLKDLKWSEERTAHLMELAKRFDLRFIHMRDRWDCEKFPGRPSVEDLKERYYGILTQLDKARGTNLSQGLRYDAAHERRRKQQLSLLYGRTKDQVEEEQRLIMELRKIEARRKERERKKQDLQKLISLADSVTRECELSEHTGYETNTDDTNSWLTSTHSSVGGGLSSSNNSLLTSTTLTGNTGLQRKRPSGVSGLNASNNSIGNITSSSSQLIGNTNSLINTDSSCTNLTSLGVAGGANTGASISSGDICASLNSASNTANTALNTQYSINFLDVSKNPGAHLRSQKMKLPSNLGQKKTRIIENFLGHLQIDPNPPATAEIVEAYNGLRSKILLLFDLRLALLNCDLELHSARLRLETFAPNKPLPCGLASLPNPSISESPEDSYYNLIDPLILSALRVADSKRPILPRHSLGVAGTLAAAAGSLGMHNMTSGSSGIPPMNTTTEKSDTKQCRLNSSSIVNSSDNGQYNSSGLTTTRSSPALSGGGGGTGNLDSDNSSSAGDGIGSSQRRRRAAALEQGRVLKKLKIKGQLVD